MTFLPTFPAARVVTDFDSGPLDSSEGFSQVLKSSSPGGDTGRRGAGHGGPQVLRDTADGRSGSASSLWQTGKISRLLLLLLLLLPSCVLRFRGKTDQSKQSLILYTYVHMYTYFCTIDLQQKHAMRVWIIMDNINDFNLYSGFLRNPRSLLLTNKNKQKQNRKGPEPKH